MEMGLVKNDVIKYSLALSILCIILSIILFDNISFWFLGMGISVIGFIILYLINKKER